MKKLMKEFDMNRYDRNDDKVKSLIPLLKVAGLERLGLAWSGCISPGFVRKLRRRIS